MALEGFLTEQRIDIGRSDPHSPNDNGIAERPNRRIMESTRAMLEFSELPRSFWAEVATQATDIRNRFPRAGQERTPFETAIGRKPRIDHLRIFGAHAWVMIAKEKRNKLDSKSEEGVASYALRIMCTKFGITKEKQQYTQEKRA